MGRDALRAVTSADVAALLPGGGGAGTRVFTAVCVAPGGDRFYLGDDDGDIIACRVVRGADADGIVGASVRVDAVANIADDDILNHAPFEDSDDEDSVAGSCAQLSPRVMRLEYMASLNCVIAMTPRRGLTVHHLGLIDPHGRAPIERMRSGRISGTSGAVAFALDASKTHPTCVAVSRAGRKKPVKNIQFFDIIGETDEWESNPRRTGRIKPRAVAVPAVESGLTPTRLGIAHPAMRLGWHGAEHTLHVGTDRWFCAVNTKTGAARDVVPLVNHPGYEEGLGLTHVEMLPIVEEDGTRVTVCVTGHAGAVLSPEGTPAGKALQFCGSSSGPRGPVRYALAFAGPYLVAVDVDGVNPAAVFDRAKPGGEPWEGEPVQFIDTFAGGTEADRSEQSAIAVSGVNGTLVACMGSRCEVYAASPVLAQVKGLLSQPHGWALAADIADAQCEPIAVTDLDVDENSDHDFQKMSAEGLMPWIVTHAEAGFCAAHALDFRAATSHWCRAGERVVRPVEDVARVFLPRLLPRRTDETDGKVTEEVATSTPRYRKFWGLRPPPADVDSVIASALRDDGAGTTRASRRSVAPIAGDVGPELTAFAALLRGAKKHLSRYLSNHRAIKLCEGPSSPGEPPFDQSHSVRSYSKELDTVVLGLWAECGELNELEQALVTGEHAACVHVLKDACVRNKRWHALALLYDKNGQKPRGESDETAAAETWRSLALGHLVEGVDTDGEGAVAGRGAQSVACEFATQNVTRIADDALDRRMDDDVSRIVMRHVAWITDVDKHAGLKLLTRPRTLTCLPLRTATRVLEESTTCGPADVARYISTRMASSKAAARDGDAHTKYALALLAASRDDSDGATSRDHATELHNFLSRSDYFDARVVAHAVDPLNLTESDPKGDLRGWSSGKPIAAHPSVRGFASHLVLLRQKLGDHAAAIRLILDVVHGSDETAKAEAAAEAYVERRQSGRARSGEGTGTWAGDGDAAITAALLNVYTRRSDPPRWVQAARVVSNPRVRVDTDAATKMCSRVSGEYQSKSRPEFDENAATVFEKAVRSRDAANRSVETRRREAREERERSEVEAWLDRTKVDDVEDDPGQCGPVVDGVNTK